VPISPRRIVDLGCGPGNSTAVCAERWPEASIVGVDNSAEMIATAREARPEMQWIVREMTDWIQSPSPERYDLIFSSAALQWVDDHATLFPNLMRKLSDGGVLAAHMPNYDAIPNRVLREMAVSDRWRPWFPQGRAAEWRSHDLKFYSGALAGSAAWTDLWATDYLQMMPDVQAIVDWYASTGLRPYLSAIPDEGEQRAFLDVYLTRLTPYFSPSDTGNVPFSFRRIFIVAGA
jgi:trans-aconitate 2-methyltransferase